MLPKFWKAIWWGIGSSAVWGQAQLVSLFWISVSKRHVGLFVSTWFNALWEAINGGATTRAEALFSLLHYAQIRESFRFLPMSPTVLWGSTFRLLDLFLVSCKGRLDVELRKEECCFRMLSLSNSLLSTAVARTPSACKVGLYRKMLLLWPSGISGEAKQTCSNLDLWKFR